VLSGEPVEDGLGQENPGIITFDHQLGFPIARKVASISSSERPAITLIALSWVVATPSDAWGWCCGVSYGKTMLGWEDRFGSDPYETLSNPPWGIEVLCVVPGLWPKY